MLPPGGSKAPQMQRPGFGTNGAPSPQNLESWELRKVLGPLPYRSAGLALAVETPERAEGA